MLLLAIIPIKTTKENYLLIIKSRDIVMNTNKYNKGAMYKCHLKQDIYEGRTSHFFFFLILIQTLQGKWLNNCHLIWQIMSYLLSYVQVDTLIDFRIYIGYRLDNKTWKIDTNKNYDMKDEIYKVAQNTIAI